MTEIAKSTIKPEQPNKARVPLKQSSQRMREHHGF